MTSSSKSGAQRQAARRARLRAQGGLQVLVTLPPDAARALLQQSVAQAIPPTRLAADIIASALTPAPRSRPR